MLNRIELKNEIYSKLSDYLDYPEYKEVLREVINELNYSFEIENIFTNYDRDLDTNSIRHIVNVLEDSDIFNWEVLSKRFRLNGKINLSNLFSVCTFKEINLKGFNNKTGSDASYMFGSSKHLVEVDVSSLNTKNIINMQSMFKNCESLKSLDVSNFNTEHVLRMGAMFKGCNSLKRLDLSSFDTTEVEDMSEMFYGCSSLKKLDLSNFNTANVFDLSYMFKNCSSLEELDISNFEIESFSKIKGIFEGCNLLKKLFINSEMRTILENYGELDNLKDCEIISREGGYNPFELSSLF